MRRLLVLIELILTLGCSWTLAYHLVLLLRLPAGAIGIPFLAVSVVLLSMLVPNWMHRLRTAPNDGPYLLGVAALGCVTGGIALYTSRPDNDDLSFFHRAVDQLQHLTLPFSITDTVHNLPDLPPLSLVHVMTSYEPFVALAAWAIHADPLNAYQNVSAFVAGAMLPVVYILLYRQFRLSTSIALAATFVAMIFLLIDGNEHRSFGNVALVRLWQGKTILWTVFIPLTLLVTCRFLARPSLRRFVFVAMTAICGVGLSNSGIFLVPALVFATSLAYVGSYGWSYEHLRRAFLVNIASFYCVAIAAAVVVGIIPQPTNTIEWWIGWTWVWWDNLNLVIGGWASLVRDLLILLGLPFIALRRPLWRFPIFLSLVLWVLFATPITGPFWIKQLWPSAYWRLVYLFPLPWCAGLVVPAIMAHGSKRFVTLARVGAAGVVVATLFAYHTSVLTSDDGTAFKPAWEYKFRPADLAFARTVTSQLHDRNLLASEDMVVVLTLMNPTIKVEVARPSETLHAFRNANLETEGLRRVAAQTLIGTGQHSTANDAAFLASLQNGIDAIILPSTVLTTIMPLMTTASRSLGRGATRFQLCTAPARQIRRVEKGDVSGIM